MEPFIIYIGKVAVCLGIFLAVYVLFLRNTTFLRFNRIYLLLGFLASLLLPLINPTYDVVLPVPVSILESSSSVDITVAVDKSVDVWLLLGGAYLIGFVCMVVRNIYSYIRIGKLIKGGCKESLGHSAIVDNRAVKSPFSFLNYILINSEMMSAKEKELIIKHEQIHIEQRHWVDLLCSECMLLLQWFNPLAWIYVRKLKENHEFLVDKAVLASGVSPYVYQAVLVNQEFKGPVFSFANSFNYSKPLNRLSMMKKEKSAWWKRLTVLAVVPMFGLFLWASAEPNYIVEYSIDPYLDDTISNQRHQNSKDNTENPELIAFGDIELSGDEIWINKEAVSVTLDDLNAGKISESDFYILKSTSKKRDTINPVDTVKPVKTNKLRQVNESVDFKSIYSEAMSKESVKKMRKIVDGQEVESLDAVKPEDVKGFTVSDGQIIVNTKTDSEKNNSATITVKGVRSSDMKDALIFVDGAKVSSMSNLNPDDIESMSVLKGESALKLYGEEGSKGAILITTKKNAEENKSKLSASDMKKAVVFVDGKRVLNIDAVNTDDIESIDVLKGKLATDKYGEDGGKGVVLIRTKKGDSFGTDLNSNGKRTLAINQLAGNLKPLYIVDDKKVSSIDDIKPEDIESVSVFKEQAALDTYGEEGKNGVIVVKMKKK